MSMLVIMGLFLLKHGVLAHVVDFGYSWSRRSQSRLWWLGLVGQCAIEAAVSLFLLHNLFWRSAVIALVLEQTALVVSSLVERRAPLRKLLQVHIYCELLVVAVYVFIAWFWAEAL